MGPGVPRSTVYPSGAALTVSIAAICPSAPTLFSIITGWPTDLDTDAPRIRATVSEPEPAGTDTTIRMGLLGNWAVAAVANIASAIAANVLLIFIKPPPWVNSATVNALHKRDL